LRETLDSALTSWSTISKVRPMSTFRIQEFAELAGVTVRALHHYDRLKLLSPAHRSERGYRIYCHEDLGRLERILALRYLGLSLGEISALLNTPVDRGAETLTVTLARQRAALSERRDGLDRVLRAIEHAQRRTWLCRDRGSRTRVGPLPDHPEGDTNARSYRLVSQVLRSGGL
jgi:DNA-binding transcriptional MerR regulator